jgi:hypothetical protein
METRFYNSIQREERKRLKAEKEQNDREKAQKDQDDIDDQILWEASSSGFIASPYRSKTPKRSRSRASTLNRSQSRSQYVLLTSYLLVAN